MKLLIRKQFHFAKSFAWAKRWAETGVVGCGERVKLLVTMSERENNKQTNRSAREKRRPNEQTLRYRKYKNAVAKPNKKGTAQAKETEGGKEKDRECEK